MILVVKGALGAFFSKFEIHIENIRVTIRLELVQKGALLGITWIPKKSTISLRYMRMPYLNTLVILYYPFSSKEKNREFRFFRESEKGNNDNV